MNTEAMILFGKILAWIMLVASVVVLGIKCLLQWQYSGSTKEVLDNMRGRTMTYPNKLVYLLLALLSGFFLTATCGM